MTRPGSRRARVALAALLVGEGGTAPPDRRTDAVRDRVASAVDAAGGGVGVLGGGRDAAGVAGGDALVQDFGIHGASGSGMVRRRCPVVRVVKRRRACGG